MADEQRSYPPSERRLSRLWAKGATPASGALVGVAVVAAAWLLALAAGPVALDWGAELVREGFAAAAAPGCPEEAAAGMLLRGLAVIAMVTLTLLSVALLAQTIQCGPKPAGTQIDLPEGRQSSTQQGIDALQIMRGILMVSLSVAAVAGTVHATVSAAPEMLRAADLRCAMSSLVAAVAWPLLLVLVGAAILDALLGRVAWRQVAWMTRRELEQESRESAGHPLNRKRRDATMRGR